jgi:hypothetical protein
MKIDFELDTAYGKYRDALYLPDDHSFTQEQISEMQTERVNAWIYSIENPPVPEPEIIEIDGVRYKKVEVGGQILLKPVLNIVGE